MTVLEIDNVTKAPVSDAPTPTEETVAPDEAAAPATREVRHEYTPTLPALLNQLGVSLLVSTYQAGKVVTIGAAEGELTLSYHNFERAMGLAVGPDRIAVGARAQVWFLRSAPDLARRVEPAGRRRWPSFPASRGAWLCTAASPSSACRRSARPRRSAACRSRTGGRG